jgi:hypothetical protein
VDDLPRISVFFAPAQLSRVPLEDGKLLAHSSWFCAQMCIYPVASSATRILPTCSRKSDAHPRNFKVQQHQPVGIKNSVYLKHNQHPHRTASILPSIGAVSEITNKASSHRTPGRLPLTVTCGLVFRWGLPLSSGRRIAFRELRKHARLAERWFESYTSSGTCSC